MPEPGTISVELEPLLWAAAERGDSTAIRRLFFRGVNIEARDPYGRTAFHIASENKHTGAMRTILAAREAGFMRRIGLFPGTGEDTDGLENAFRDYDREYRKIAS